MARKFERRTWSEWFRGDNNQKARRRLAVEILEDRSVPATVTTLLDGPDVAQPIPGSLRAAIIEAARTDGQVDFDPTLFSAPGRQTLVLNGAVGALIINSGQNITITGPGADKLTIQSDYGFTAASASSTGANFRQGDQLRQKRDTTGTNGYQGGAIFTVTSINDGANGVLGDGIGSITGVAVSNPGSNSKLLGTQVTLSQSSTGQFQLEPINGTTGTGATITVLNTSYALNPGIITQQMTVAGNNTLTISGVTFGDTSGNAITQNLGNLVINNCAFGAFDGTIINAKSDPTNISFNKFLVPADNPGNFNIFRETTNFIYSDIGAGNLTVGTSSFTNASQRAIDFTPAGRTLTVSATTGISSSFQSNDVAAIRATTQAISISSTSLTGNGDGSAGEGPLRLAGTTSVSLANVTISANAVAAASTTTQGGSLITGGAVTITGARVAGNIPNAASTQGTLRISTAGTVSISDSVFDGNNTVAASQFRSVEILGNPSSVSISNSAFTNNTAGGALAIRANTSNISNSYFANNTASRTLPATYASAISGISGGAALVSMGSGITTINSSVFRGNSLAAVTSANSGGGAVFSDIGGLNIDKSVFEANTVAITGFPSSFPLPDLTVYASNPERQPAPRYSGGGAIRSGFSTTINATEFANNTVTSVVDFWLPPNSVSPANQAVPAHGGGGALYLTRDTDNSSTNRITNTTFFGNSAIQVSQGLGNANILATGKGLNGGALIIADGRSPSVPNYTATDAPRAGSSATQIINTTITGNSLVNPFADKFNSNYLSGANAYTNADTGGMFNDTRTGSTISTLNTINVQNTGIIYNSPTHPSAPGDPVFGLANTGSRAATGVGTFGSAGYTMANPLTSPGFTLTGTPGNLTGSDQNAGIDSKGLQDNLGPTVGVSSGVTLPGVASNLIFQSVLQSVAIDRLSPARDSGQDTTLAPFNILTDVRGVPRFINVAVDLGAVELQTTTKTSVTSTVPGTIEYGQVQTVDVKVDFDDSKASASNITGVVRLVTMIPDSQGNNIITEYGRATLNPTTGASPPNSTATITLNPDSSNLLPPGSNILFAQYLGDNTYVTSQASPFTLNIDKATTTTKFNPSVPNPANTTDSTILFTGSVSITHPGSTPVSTGLLPTGTVTISQRQVGGSGFTDLVTAPLQADGTFSIPLTGTPTIASVLANGVYDIRARFNPSDSSKFATDSTDSGQTIANGGDIKQEVGITPTIAVSFKDSLGSPITSIERGEVVTLEALVTPDDTDLVQPGSITFVSNGIDLVTVARADSGPGRLYTASINTGDPQYSLPVNSTAYQITARYNRNDSGIYNTTISPASSLTITNQSTVTTLTVTPAGPVFYGDKVDLIATTAPRISGSIVPFAAGSISFNDTLDGLLSGPNTTPANANPSSSFSTTSLSVGSHSLTASYSGDGTNYAASTSTAINLTVNKASTTTTFASVPSPAIVNLGGSITFNIAVATPAINAPQKPSGSVVFSNTAGVIDTVAINQTDGTATYAYTPSAFTAGDTITATYSGDTNYAGSSNTIIVTVPNFTLSPIAASPVQRGNTITLTATMDPSDNDVNQPGSVDFFYGSTVITSVPRSASTVVNGKQVYSTTINTGDNAFNLPVSANPYSIQARYNSNGGNFPTTLSGSQTLSIIAQDTTTLIASPQFPIASSGTIVYGNRFDLSASVAPSIFNSIIPFASQATGIRILDNGVVIATLPVSNDARSAVLSKTDFAVGTHSLTAQFIGDGNYVMSTSLPFALSVTPAGTTVSLTSGGDYLALGQTFTLNASIFSNAQTMPTQISGVVSFTATGPGGTTNLPTGAISVGNASSTFTPTLPGRYTITANYLGDANYQPSAANRSLTASSVSIEVTDANGSQTISSAPRGSSVTLTARLTPADSTAIDTLTGLPVQPGSVSFRLSNGTVITAVARPDSNPINGDQVYSATINTGNNEFSLPVGVAMISARYNANGGLYPQVDSTTPATLTITRQATTTTLTAPQVASVTYGSSITFGASVSPTIAASGANSIPFGNSQIQFFNASALIQSTTVNDANRSATLSLDLLPVGSYLISARYAGDNANYLASRSTDSAPAFALGVTQASTTTTLSLSSPAIDSGSSVLITATVGSGATGNALRPSGTVNFFNNGTPIGSGTVNQATGVVTFSYRPPAVGGYSLSASYAGDANYSASSSGASSPLVVNTFQPFYAIAMQGGSKFATFSTRTNTLIATYQPNGPRYTGGFTLARGDVNGDGVADLLWATNRGSFVRIIDGLTSHDLGGFFAFSSSLNSPVSIAVGDINKDGKGDIMVAAAGRNAGGLVRVYSGANYGQLLYQGSPYGQRFGGGISLASGDVDGDGWADIISSPLSAGVARVVVVSGKTQSVIRNFLAQTPVYTGGISVAAADLNNDGRAEIITATNSGRGIVSVFNGSAPFNSGVQAPALGQLVIGGARFTGGARAAVVSDINGDGLPDLLITMGPGGGAGASRHSFNPTTRNFQLIDSLFAFSSREPGSNNGLRPA